MLLPFTNDSLDIDLRATWNARVGVRHQLSDRLAMGGGLFTDRSPNGTPDEFQEAQLDFYGLTIGLEMGTVYGVYSKDGVPYAKPKGLKYATTFGLSYALGAGSIMQAQVAATPEGGVTRQNVLQDVIAHEFTLHVGQTVME